ncbi:MAG: serine O-acetyltransferase [Bacteroidales bacterium]|nr:serine O-acetyltransferase [Bacteroidales bacterium]MCF8390782.1 serine O-acetyltransferase [Bacteroidales bacterium]
MKESFPQYLNSINQSYCSEVPSMVDTHSFVDDLIHLLFPIRINKYISLQEIEIRMERMQLRLKELLIPMQKELMRKPSEISAEFFLKVPEVYKIMLKDADTLYKSDPAASCVEEVILSYPGFYSLCTYRLANLLYKLKVPVIPRVMTEYVHGKTGIDINPGAKIGKNFFMDHGTGIVIGETAVIGDNVKIYQGVTLGAIYVEKKMKNSKRHPTIEDNVIIYAGSTILGGDTIVGHDTIIGGNVWLTQSVAPNSVVYGQHKITIRDNKDFTEPINFSI